MGNQAIDYKNLRISELHTRADFASIMTQVINPLLLSGVTEEPSLFEQIFRTFQVGKSTIQFPFLDGLVVGKITEGEEIPFTYIGYGIKTITVEDYGIRVGFTRQQIREDELDLMRYTAEEVGRAHTRTKNMVAFAALEAGAGNSAAAATPGTLALVDIRAAKLAGSKFVEANTGIFRPVQFTHLIVNQEQHDDLLPVDNNTIPPGIVLNFETGEISGVLGLRLVITNWITAGVALILRAQERLLYLVRESISIDNAEVFATAAEEIRTIEAFGFAILDSNHVYKITGA